MSAFAKTRELLRRLARFLTTRRIAPARHSGDYHAACRELAYWGASDAGLDGAVDAFDGSLLDPAADGMCTIRMTVRDSIEGRPAAAGAVRVINALTGLRVLLLLEIDGVRFVSMPPNVNAGVRDFARAFADSSRRAG